MNGLIAAARYGDLTSGGQPRLRGLEAAVRQEAVVALAAAGRDQALEAVEERLSDPADRVRCAAVRVLAVWGETEALEAAVAQLPADGGNARDMARRALVRLRKCQDDADPPAAGAEEEGPQHVEADPEPEPEETAHPDPEPQPQETADPEPQPEGPADRSSAEPERMEDDRGEVLVAALRDDADAPGAVVALGRLGDRRALRPLVDALEHPDSEVRARSCAALADLRDPAAVEPLLRATRDPEYRVRTQAAEALDRMGNLAAIVGIPALVQPMMADAAAVSRSRR